MTSITVPHDFVSFSLYNIEKLMFGCILPVKNITILSKITINFWQLSLKGVLLAVRVLEYLGKILEKYLSKS